MAHKPARSQHGPFDGMLLPSHVDICDTKVVFLYYNMLPVVVYDILTSRPVIALGRSAIKSKTQQ